jgi:hypothetical protein
MREHIIGPLTPDQKSELRGLLTRLGESVEESYNWSHTSLTTVRWSNADKQWMASRYEPNITFEEFKALNP